MGTARWRYTENGIKLERFAVKKNGRGHGIGSALLVAVLEDIATLADATVPLYLHAQLNAVAFYRRHGFKITGNAFEECGIRHRKMVRT